MGHGHVKPKRCDPKPEVAEESDLKRWASFAHSRLNSPRNCRKFPLALHKRAQNFLKGNNTHLISKLQAPLQDNQNYVLIIGQGPVVAKRRDSLAGTQCLVLFVWFGFVALHRLRSACICARPPAQRSIFEQRLVSYLQFLACVEEDEDEDPISPRPEQLWTNPGFLCYWP